MVAVYKGTNTAEMLTQKKYPRYSHCVPCYAIQVINIFSFAVSDVIH